MSRFTRKYLHADLTEEQHQMKIYLTDKGYHLPTLMRNLLMKLYAEEKNKELFSPQLPNLTSSLL